MMIHQQLPFYCDPEQVFHRLYHNKPNAVWLDSAALIDGFSRFSFIACADSPHSYVVEYAVGSHTTLKTQQGLTTTIPLSIFDFLQQELTHHQIDSPDLPFDFNGGFIGYFGFEMKAETMGMVNRYQSQLPDAKWLFIDRFIAFDRLEKVCYLVSLFGDKGWFETISTALSSISILPSPVGDPLPSTGEDPNKQHYVETIHRALQHIHDGETYEICLTTQLKMDTQIDPLTYYQRLRQLNPTPYAAFLQFNQFAIACSSMERFLTIDRQRQVETKPIKGTLPRGQTPEADRQLSHQLQHDERFRAENLMIVDLLRNDLSQVCQIGSVHVPTLMACESYRSVHQLVSTIRGQLKPSLHTMDCIKATFPGGSMTGAPKRRTLQLLDTLETQARGIYSGTLGYLALNGCIDLNIVIRTAIIHPNQISIGIGGAITALSNHEDEYQEICLKAYALQQALDSAHFSPAQ